MSRRPSAVGVLGGSFDPIHRGHLAMARAAERAAGLERIYFVPAARPWHKPPPQASYADRYAMLALALAGRARWLPLDIPAPASRPTYSVDQLGWMQRHHAGERLHFIVGADAFVTLRIWKRCRALLGMCDFVVLGRPPIGLREVVEVIPSDLVCQVGAEGVELAGGRRLHWVGNFANPASSTRARQSRRTAQALVPATVAAYAGRAGLYSYGKTL